MNHTIEALIFIAFVLLVSDTGRYTITVDWLSNMYEQHCYN